MEYSAEKFVGVVDRINAAMAAISSKEVQIGIPAAEADRDDGAQIDNVTLGYIHEYGAPEVGIPARPFLIPGVEKAQPKVLPILEAACRDMMDFRRRPDIEAVLNRCGSIAVSEVKGVWQDNNWKPLAESTINRRIARQGATGGNSRWRREYRRFEETGDTSGLAGQIEPLKDTGSLQASITWVVGDVNANA